MNEKFKITQEAICTFADVAGDPNPIHQDIVAAQQMGLEGPIAHGMFVYCYLLQRIDAWIAKTKKESDVAWTLKTTRCRFSEPAIIGKTFTSNLEIGEEKDGLLKLQLTFLGEDGKKLTSLAATLERKV